MSLKGIHYILISTVSIFIMAGCGGSSSADNNSNENITEGHEQVAILIQESEIKTTSTLNEKQSISPSIPLNKTILKTVKEDASNANTDKWIVYDKSPSGATITNVFDQDRVSSVIKFQGDGLRNGFVTGFWTATPWKDTQHKVIQWSMNYSENYMIYVRLNTPEGYRYLYYTPSDYNYGVSSYDNPHYIHHGLGTNSNDGTWRTFSRDLSADLKEFDSDNSISSVDGFFIRGSGMVDDIALLKEDTSTEPTPTLTITEAINTWLLNKNESINSGMETILSNDKTRAIVYAHAIVGAYTDRQYILDISDINNIQQLAEEGWYRSAYPKEVKIKEGDYIILAGSRSFVIYDYNSGERMSDSYFSFYTPIGKYLLITDNYAIYTQQVQYTTPMPHNRHHLQKIDFSDRKNPIITTLYIVEEDASYSLSPDETKVLAKDKDGNLINEINLLEEGINESDYNLTINPSTRLKTTEKGFELYDVSNPQIPTLLSSYDISDSRTCSAYLLSEDKQHLFIHAWQREYGCDTHFSGDLPFQIVNISDFSNPTLKATTTLSRDYYGNVNATWEHLGNNIYLISSEGELALYDLNNYIKTASFIGQRIVKTTISTDKIKLYVLSAPAARFRFNANTLSVLNLENLSIHQEYAIAATGFGEPNNDPNFIDFELIEDETRIKLIGYNGEIKIIDL